MSEHKGNCSLWYGVQTCDICLRDEMGRLTAKVAEQEQELTNACEWIDRLRGGDVYYQRAVSAEAENDRLCDENIALRAAVVRAERWLRQANCMMEAQDLADLLLAGAVAAQNPAQ